MPDQIEPLDRLKVALADRYRIERELGRGGMATVYLAEDLKHRRPVAVKVLRPELAAAIGPERFLREIEITARLDHPHILPLLDSGEADSFLFYVMPYVEGESLRERLEREKQLAIDDAIQITREVADALDFAHQRDVIHRDIKPENILLAAGHARVADFGIARAIGVAGGDRLTETGLAVGTPEYMSPEQAAGESDLDGRSDVYALGCLLYEMLAGQPPFTGPTMESIVRQHLGVDAHSIASLRPTVAPEVAQAIARSLAKAPADRYATANAFADALLTGQARVEAGLIRRKGVRLAGLAALILVLVSVGLFLSLRSWSASEVATTGPMARAEPSVAVLPLTNFSGGEAREYIADGMTAELITTLNKLESLAAIGHRSVMRFKGSDQPTTEIARMLGVTHVVDGSVLQVDDSVRITVDLYTATSDLPLWGESFTRGAREVMTLQREVALAVAEKIAVELTPEDRERLRGTPEVDPEAWDLYIKGTQARNRLTAESLSEAMGHFEQAIAEDPTYAPAYAGLASALFFADFFTHADRAEALTDKALSLNPRLAEAYIVLGLLREHVERDFASAEEAFRTAIRVHPGNAEAYMELGMLLMRQGQFDEALRHAQQSLFLNPLSARFQGSIALVYFFADRYEQAHEAVTKTLELDSSHVISYMLRGRIFAQQERYGEAIRAHQMFLRTASSDVAAFLGYAYAKSGQREKALNLLKDLEARWRQGDTNLTVPRALIHAGLSEKQETLALLEWAVEQGLPDWSNFQDPEFRFLREEPRFQSLLRKIGVE